MFHIFLIISLVVCLCLLYRQSTRVSQTDVNTLSTSLSIVLNAKWRRINLVQGVFISATIEPKIQPSSNSIQKNDTQHLRFWDLVLGDIIHYNYSIENV